MFQCFPKHICKISPNIEKPLINIKLYENMFTELIYDNVYHNYCMAVR